MVLTMARDNLDRKIKEIKDELLVQQSMVEQMTLQAVQALVQRDMNAAQRIYEYDRRVNQKHLEIEKQCLTLMATEPPILATDLRLLASILEINSILENFGDYAKGIARTCLAISGDPPVAELVQITLLAEKVVELLHDALGAFVSGDIDKAQHIPCTSTEILDAAADINQVLFSEMIGNPGNIQQVNKLLYISHNLERMADLVSNICERTVYISTGDLKSLKQSLK